MKAVIVSFVLVFGLAAQAGGDFQNCSVGSLEPLKTEAFRHSKNYIVTAFFAGHTSDDALAVTDRGISIVGKFSYGLVSKDLEDERVDVYLDDCSSELRHLGGSLTNSDGRSNLIVDAEDLPGPGRYKVVQRVAGDGTVVESVLTILPRGTELFIFDIDGTLTKSDVELWKEIGASAIRMGYDQSAREGSVAATKYRHETQGYHLIYLTGRHYTLTNCTRGWLKSKKFAPGTLQVAPSILEVLPTEGGVGAYKGNYLKSLQGKGFHLAGAYGNSTTDIFAYAQAGILKEQTFILGEHGGEENTVKLGEDFKDHLASLMSEMPATSKEHR